MIQRKAEDNNGVGGHHGVENSDDDDSEPGRDEKNGIVIL
jgi:hypothetical protein